MPKAPLPKSEWCFDDLPPKEVEPCYLYEFGREHANWSREFQKLLREWRRATAQREKEWLLAKKQGKGKFAYSVAFSAIRDMQRRLRNFFEGNEVVGRSFPRVEFDVFPETPWQELKDKEPKGERRAWLLEGFRRMGEAWWNHELHDRLWLATQRELKESNAKTIEDFEDYHRLGASAGERSLDQTEYGFFAVDWNAPDRKIRQAFEIWLNKQRVVREASGISRPKAYQTGRGGFRDRLRWLGALRVKEYYTRADLLRLAIPNLARVAPYSKLPDLYEAAPKAEAELARLFPPLG